MLKMLGFGCHERDRVNTARCNPTQLRRWASFTEASLFLCRRMKAGVTAKLPFSRPLNACVRLFLILFLLT